MTDWRLRAASTDRAIDVDRILPVMEGLEKSFEPLVESISAWSDIWTGPEDVA